MLVVVSVGVLLLAMAVTIVFSMPVTMFSSELLSRLLGALRDLLVYLLLHFSLERFISLLPARIPSLHRLNQDCRLFGRALAMLAPSTLLSPAF